MAKSRARKFAELLDSNDDIKSDRLDNAQSNLSTSSTISTVDGTADKVVIRDATDGQIKLATITDAALQGPAGADGATGADGADGADGAAGAAGATGPKGAGESYFITSSTTVTKQGAGDVIVWGAGGGGGGCFYFSTRAGGSSGGIGVLNNIADGATITITIGSAGSQGTGNASSGGTGGTTTVSASGQTLTFYGGTGASGCNNNGTGSRGAASAAASGGATLLAKMTTSNSTIAMQSGSTGNGQHMGSAPSGMWTTLPLTSASSAHNQRNGYGAGGARGWNNGHKWIYPGHGAVELVGV